MPAARLPRAHVALALAVVAVWGTNFVVVRVALDALPPLWLATLRFALAVVPAVFVVRRPPVGWANLAAYGGAIGAGQFGLLFVAMDGRITPGLASLVVQTQVFFTIGLAMLRDGEHVTRRQLAALMLAALGLALIGWRGGGGVTPLGLAMVLGAAACWGLGNAVNRAASRAAQAAGDRLDMLGYVVWASVFSLPPLLALALAREGLDGLRAGVQAATPGVWAAVAWQAVGNTLFGYAAWAWLLARHPAASVAPLSLGVPLFGLGASALVLGEPLPAWKLGAAALVMAGLALNTLGPRPHQ